MIQLHFMEFLTVSATAAAQSFSWEALHVAIPQFLIRSQTITFTYKSLEA